VGTIVSRLARARQRLRNRLTRRGLAPAAVAVLLGASATHAALPSHLAEAVIRSAALVAAGETAAASASVVALTKGVLLAMCVSKAKVVGGVLLGLVLLGGAFCAIGLVTEVERSNARATAAWYQAQAARPMGEVAWRGGSGIVPPAMGATAPKPGAPAADDKARLKEARDEVEVLEAQLEVKRAQVAAAKIASDAAAEQQARLAKLAGGGTVTEKEVSAARSAAALAKAQLLIREAELREPLVRLKQARDRLKLMEGAAAPPPAAIPHGLQERLRGLEGKLEALRKEVQALRKELGAENAPPGASVPGMRPPGGRPAPPRRGPGNGPEVPGTGQPAGVPETPEE
jgi:hypothetical protein